MAVSINAVIAALRTELQQAERSHDVWVKTNRCNRWIGQLPGGRWKWRNLLLTGDSSGEVQRASFITHVKASLAYLETIRDDTLPNTSLLRSLVNALRRAPREPLNTPDEPIDADFTDVPMPSTQKRLPKPKVVK